MPHTTSLIVHIACIYISVGAAAEDSPTKTVAGQNVFGAVLFFSYIVAALVISNLIVADICTVSSSRYRASGLWPEEVPALNEVSLAGQKDEQVYQRAIGNQIKSRILFPVAASISFTVLSWNMLHFLVVCYQAWTTGHGIPLFYRLRTVADLYYQSKQVWAWATDSTLFQTFAEDLLSSPGTWKRVRLSLLYSYGCNLWMSMLGQQYNVPHLWMYFVLNQILPVSFSQNLFCTVMEIVKEQHAARQTIRPVLPIRVAALLCYVVLLFCVPSALNTYAFLPVLLALRLLLFTPFLIDVMARDHGQSNEPDVNAGVSKIYNWFSLALVLVGVGGWLLRPTPATAQHELVANHAAAALSDDMWIGVASGVFGYIIAVS